MGIDYNEQIQALKKDLYRVEAELAKCRDQYEDLTAHYLEMKEQRDALREAAKEYLRILKSNSFISLEFSTAEHKLRALIQPGSAPAQKT